MANNYDETVADMQQYYNFDVTNINEDNFERACILCSQLPPGSRLMGECNSALAWDNLTTILANIEYEMRVLLYSMSKKSGRGSKPKPLEPPKNKKDRERERKSRLTLDGYQIEAMDYESLKRKLNIVE